jgi:hypothetical protein
MKAGIDNDLENLLVTNFNGNVLNLGENNSNKEMEIKAQAKTDNDGNTMLNEKWECLLGCLITELWKVTRSKVAELPSLRGPCHRETTINQTSERAGPASKFNENNYRTLAKVERLRDEENFFDVDEEKIYVVNEVTQDKVVELPSLRGPCLHEVMIDVCDGENCEYKGTSLIRKTIDFSLILIGCSLTLVNLMEEAFDAFVEDFINANSEVAVEYKNEFIFDFQNNSTLKTEKLESSKKFEITNKIVKYPWEAIPKLCEEDRSCCVLIVPSFLVEIFKNAFAYMIYLPVDELQKGNYLLVGSKGLNFNFCEKLGQAQVVPIGKKNDMTLFVDGKAYKDVYGVMPKHLVFNVYRPAETEAFIFNFLIKYFNVKNEIVRFPIDEDILLQNRRKFYYNPFWMLFAGENSTCCYK